MKKSYVFIFVCLVIMLLPSVGLLIDHGQQESENGEERNLPSVTDEDGKLNIYYMSDMGNYYSENFAFRKVYVSANARLYGTVFHTSTTDQVLLGQNEWMYYTNTLNDYTATHLMTERGLNNVVHNLSLMQNYIEASGSTFVITIAPNKNSIYNENMPYYYNKGIAQNNFQRFEKKIEDTDIHYVNLHEAFEKNYMDTKEVLYLKQDSHWNNKGAALVYEQIMNEIVKQEKASSTVNCLDYATYGKMSYELKKDHVGDLAEMVYPLGYELEENQYYNKDWQYEYYGEVESNMDNFITTTSPKSNQVLLMYRDSFGESLLPFFADEFGVAYFSRLVPYNLNDIATYQPNVVVMERVERRLSSFAEEAAIMPMPVVTKDTSDMQVVMESTWEDVFEIKKKTEGVVTAKINGDYYQVDGLLADDTLPSDTSNIYAAFVTEDGQEVMYDTFWISKQVDTEVKDNGFSFYILQSEVPVNTASIKVYVE